MNKGEIKGGGGDNIKLLSKQVFHVTRILMLKVSLHFLPIHALFIKKQSQRKSFLLFFLLTGIL